MDKNKFHFIKTSDEETAKKLRKLGFQEISKEGSHWVFINDKTNKITFSSEGMKLSYTNVLTF